MKITLKDIAKDTGFSESTVSRVLNGSSKISTETQDIILESARRLRYLSPRDTNIDPSRKFLNVALLASDFTEGEFYVSFFNGLNQASRKNNIRLSLIGLVDPEEELQKLIKEISIHYYDAAILFIPEYTQREYVDLADNIPRGMPIISNALIENPVFPTVTFDGYSGGYLAARHLEEQSYSKLGLIQGPFQRAESRYRSNGFKDYIQQYQHLNLCWTFEGDFTFESGVRAFEQYQELEERPRAIFAANDDMANGFMEAAKQKGIHFPGDVAIIGYDNLPVCRHNQPTISSINTDYEALGMTTMKVLREMVQNPEPNHNRLSFVSVSVCHRESS
ncbi:LacI family DNA-binding transcriptional regulator [Fodinibius sediminis]|uniref:Transcriptional regulator, LacI family n=1 Tax=Fodinibius sediminis TaxID=1214077 RepID=A0A521CXY8_9BACT|nr:LacI family DNA-binding transcriptional regulator [Fodinibius sediminis]SMO63530.1 transcriptional regulator, LacI family [Fodinibius sediminis]